jgi:hypothetical protein
MEDKEFLAVVGSLFTMAVDNRTCASGCKLIFNGEYMGLPKTKSPFAQREGAVK